MRKKILWKILNWVIIINFVLEIFYGAYQTFFVFGTGLPLFGGSASLDFEHMVARRLYAIETWIAIVGLSIYLAIIYKDKFIQTMTTNNNEA
ncbi:MAG: hypothetical protein ACTSRZ_21410 [Promethearchaeota archaeon]